MRQLSATEIRDFALTMRQMLHLPSRVTATDSAGRVTQERWSGTITGETVVIVLDTTFYADTDANYPGMIYKDLYTITGPEAAPLAVATVEYRPLYDANLNLTGEDLYVNSVQVPYV